MSYTYPEAMNALQSVANDYLKTLRGMWHAEAFVIADPKAATASVAWDRQSVRIHLPVKAASTKMGEAEYQDWVSYLFHEIGHPTFTDLATWQKACAAGLGMLTNAVEDVRMEKALIGSKSALNAKAVLSRLVSRKIAEARTHGWRPNSRADIGWTIAVLGRASNGYAIDPADLAWIKGQIVPGGTVDRVLAWALPELAKATSTDDCLTIARKIAAAIAEPAPKGAGKPGNAPNSQGQGNSPATGKAPQGPANEPGEGSEDESSEGEGSEGESDSSPGKGGKGHGDGSQNDETPVLDESELNQHDLAPDTGDVLTGSTAQVEKFVLDLLRDNAKQDGRANTCWQAGLDKSAPKGLAVLRAKAAVASRQRSLLARALKANEQDERETGRRSGRLDRGALTRAAAGSPNVFAKHDVSEGFDTDVSILIDASGSMGGANIEKAVEAGLVVAQAAASVGVACTVEAFNSSGFVRAGAVASRRKPDESAFARLHNTPSGGTPLSLQIARAALAQAKRAPDKRRVLFVITDGGCDYGTNTVKRIVEYTEQTYGTVLAHVSIGTMLQGAFRAEVRVESHQRVADVGLEHFTRVLQAL